MWPNGNEMQISSGIKLPAGHFISEVAYKCLGIPYLNGNHDEDGRIIDKIIAKSKYR